MVAGSKRFTNPSKYEFSLAVYTTFDGGQTWIEPSLLLLPGWAGTSDPTIAWDNKGNVYLVALPFGPGNDTPLLGIAVYKSTDGGLTWSNPLLIHDSEAQPGDDKQWASGDTNPSSPHYGNVYAAWDKLGPMPLNKALQELQIMVFLGKGLIINQQEQAYRGLMIHFLQKYL